MDISQKSEIIEITTLIEHETLEHDKVHNSTRAMVTLALNDRNGSKLNNMKGQVPIDFIVLIDVSSSMKEQQKLAFVQASIEYMVNLLSDRHRFALILFNEEVKVMCDLLPMTNVNRSKVIELLHTIKPEGSTNISAALFHAVHMLNHQGGLREDRLSFVFLLTDGLTNRGMSSNELVQQLKSSYLPNTTTIHTFGFGSDHDSHMLQGTTLSCVIPLCTVCFKPVILF